MRGFGVLVTAAAIGVVGCNDNRGPKLAPG
jgi:hypothetical protein